MYRKVNNWFNISEMEKGILEFWKENDIFNKLKEKNKHGRPWSFIDGPITANNPMGVHHSWGRALKDAYQRYWSMNGRKLRFQNGFDCQGLWVEVEVEKELGFKTKRDIENYGIDRFIDKCKERVIKYSRIITDQSIRLGYCMDWNDSYYTMSNENNYTIWNFLKKCHDRGFIYKGHDVMPWCPRCGTGLSQHEMHEGYKEVKHTSLYMRFPLLNSDNNKIAFLVWTTTPWTLTSNIALAVHPHFKYVKVIQGEWMYYIIKDRVEIILGDKGPWRIIEEINGSEMADLHLKYQGPYDEFECQKTVKNDLGYHSIILWDEITTQEGTGIVHIAPGCGAEDFQLGKEFNLPIIDPIDDAGYFKKGFDWFTGRNAGEVANDVVEDLQRKEILYFPEVYEHKYPHCWRCNSELLFRLVDEWFIGIDPWRNEIMENAKQMKWIPSFGLDLELDWLSNMRDWMISKKRYWGLALPIWECPDCNGFSVIGSLNELREKAIEGIESVLTNGPHRPWIDDVKIKCPQCGRKISRITDVGNPWLDAGIVPYSTVAYNENREYWREWVPADLILECFPGQFRNWFYSLLAMSTIMENIPPSKTLLGHSLVKDAHGEEMHKSKGNAIWFDDAVEKIGADVLRWQFFIHDISNDMHFSFDNAKLLRGKFFNTLWNCYAFYINYARLIGFQPYTPEISEINRNEFDRYILSKLHYTIRTSREGIESYDLKSVCKSIDNFIDDLSNWYVRHNRRRFWKTEVTDDTLVAYDTLFKCIYGAILLLAPMLPMLTEEIYQNLVRNNLHNAPESIHLTDYPVADDSLIDMLIFEEMEVIKDLIAIALSIRNKAKIKVRQPLSGLIIAVDDEKEKTVISKYSKIIMDDLNVKEVSITSTRKDCPKSSDFLIADYKNGWIALNKHITQELESEGLVREFIRKVQVLRKKIGLEPEDRIEIFLDTELSRILNVVKQYNNIICSELLCNRISERKNIKNGYEIEINNEKSIISIIKCI